MKRNQALVLGVLYAAAMGTTFAANLVDDDAMAVVHAKIPMAQAIAVAERHVNGKAARAEYEKTKEGWVYEVEVVSGNKVFDVKVDGNNGRIIAATEDKADHDDKHDKKD